MLFSREGVSSRLSETSLRGASLLNSSRMTVLMINLVYIHGCRYGLRDGNYRLQPRA